MATQHEAIASRYTKALWDLTKDKNSAEVLAELESFSQSYTESAEFQKFISTPMFSEEEKSSVLKNLCSEMKLSESLQKFFLLLLNNGRIETVTEVTRQYRDEVFASENRAELNIESAFELTEEQKNKIVSALESSTGKKLQAHVKVNPKLVAGIRVHVLGQNIDASLMNSLGNLKQQLLQGEAN